MFLKRPDTSASSEALVINCGNSAEGKKTETEEPRESTMPFSSCCQPAPVALGPLGADNTLTTSYPTSPPPSPTRFHRPRRVLYPAFQSRRPPLREAPDKACRWLLFLSVLVFLQIYMEDAHICTALEGQCPDPAACPPEDNDGSLGTAQGWSGEEPWRIQTVGGASETQMECVVA